MDSGMKKRGVGLAYVLKETLVGWARLITCEILILSLVALAHHRVTWDLLPVWKKG
jgi:hypothetical protein